MNIEASTARRMRIQIIQTPTGPMSVIRPLAEQLLKQGIISGTLDGTLHAADAMTVKAAMATSGVCDFCSGPGIEHGFDVTDFNLPGLPGMPDGAWRSTDGWAACGPCGELINAGKRKDLLARAINSLSFAKFSKPAIEELHHRFWEGLRHMATARGIAQGLSDFVENKRPLPEGKTWGAEASSRDKRLGSISKSTGLSVKELEQVLTGDVPPPLASQLLAWSKRVGVTGDDAARLKDLLEHKPLLEVIPHWQQALDAKYAVLAMLNDLITKTDVREYFSEAIDVHDLDAVKRLGKIAEARAQLKALSVDEDYRSLHTSQVYSFNAETAAAIQEAAHGIPHDAPLSSIETPNTGSGWFWFSAQLPVASAPISSDNTQALLWSWTNEVPGLPNQPALVFSAYVKTEKKAGLDALGSIYPAARWHWPFTMTFHEMLGYNTVAWRAVYGPGGPLEHDPISMGEAHHREVIASLSLFFIMSCLWFRQTVPGQPKKMVNPVLTQTPGHIERHARKRYQREHKLAEPPTVQVVALRKTARTDPSEAPAERVASARQYHCKWIVRGHARLQPCGPGRKDRKLLWIESYVAGPDDKPLKTKTTVYAVVR